MCAIAGHVRIEDYAVVGGLTGIHQFARVGESAMVARDLGGLPGRAALRARVGRPRARSRAERRRAAPARLPAARCASEIQHAYHLVFHSKLPLRGAARARARRDRRARPRSSACWPSSRARSAASSGSRLGAPVGLIAGQRPLPVRAGARRARRRGRRIAAVGLRGARRPGARGAAWTPAMARTSASSSGCSTVLRAAGVAQVVLGGQGAEGASSTERRDALRARRARARAARARCATARTTRSSARWRSVLEAEGFELLRQAELAPELLAPRRAARRASRPTRGAARRRRLRLADREGARRARRRPDRGGRGPRGARARGDRGHRRARSGAAARSARGAARAW